jgi:hypothetical protein
MRRGPRGARRRPRGQLDGDARSSDDLQRIAGAPSDRLLAAGRAATSFHSRDPRRRPGRPRCATRRHPRIALNTALAFPSRGQRSRRVRDGQRLGDDDHPRARARSARAWYADIVHCIVALPAQLFYTTGNARLPLRAGVLERFPETPSVSAAVQAKARAPSPLPPSGSKYSRMPPAPTTLSRRKRSTAAARSSPWSASACAHSQVVLAHTGPRQ